MLLLIFAIVIELCKNKKTALINRTVFIKVCDILLEHVSCRKLEYRVFKVSFF